CAAGRGPAGGTGRGCRAAPRAPAGTPPLPAPSRDAGRARASSAREWRWPPRDACCRARCLRRSTASLFVRELESHVAVTIRIVAPVVAHLDEQKQVHGSFDHVGYFAPRVCADRLDRPAALAEHDLTLALALDIDRLLDSGRAVLEFLS